MLEYKVRMKEKIDLHEGAKIKAKYIMDEQIPFDELCWELAEFKLIHEKGHGHYSDQDLIDYAEMIFNNLPTYEEVCLLIGIYKEYFIKHKIYPYN